MSGEQKTELQWCQKALRKVLKLSNIIGYLPADTEGTLQTVVREVQELYRPEFSAVYMVDEMGSLRLSAIAGMGPLEEIHKSDSMEHCLALRDGLPYIGCDETGCPNRSSHRPPLYSHICIPIVSARETYGVLSLTFKERDLPDKEGIELLLSIASQTSSAIHRERLFENLKKEKQEIERAYRKIKRLNELLQGKINELEETQQRLVQSEKLAATGLLAAGLCHEINNPLSVVLNRIECIRMEAGEMEVPEGFIRDLEVIYANLSRVSSVVQNLLVFSRHHPVRFEVVNIKDILDDVMHILKDELLSRGCTVLTEFSERASTLYCDRERICQVLRNLLSNAIDSMPEGGRIWISTSPSARAGYIEMAVKDEGIGIPEEHLPRIFDPFFTTKPLGEGTGLGLSICYGIVKAHRGEIRVESTPHIGTTFRLLLPACKDALEGK